jgi:hypothetical protein
LAEILPEKWYPEQKCKISAKLEIAQRICDFGKAKCHLSCLCRIAAFGPSKQIKTACLYFDLKVDQNKITHAVVFLFKIPEIAIFNI